MSDVVGPSCYVGARRLKPGIRTGTGRKQIGETHPPPLCREVRPAASPVTSRHASSWVLKSGISASTAACVTSGLTACLPTALWRRVPVYTDTLFVSIGACLAGGPTHPECCFGMKLGMEPDATENLGKGSLPSEAGRAECSYPQGFKRQSQIDIIKKKILINAQDICGRG